MTICSAVHYVRFSMHTGMYNSIWTQLKNPLAKAIVIVALPIGFAVYLRDRMASGAKAS